MKPPPKEGVRGWAMVLIALTALLAPLSGELSRCPCATEGFPDADVPKTLSPAARVLPLKGEASEGDSRVLPLSGELPTPYFDGYKTSIASPKEKKRYLSFTAIS